MKAKLAANPTFWALIILGVLTLASIAVTWWMPSLNENQTNEEGAPVTIHVAHEITPASSFRTLAIRMRLSLTGNESVGRSDFVGHMNSDRGALLVRLIFV